MGSFKYWVNVFAAFTPTSDFAIGFAALFKFLRLTPALAIVTKLSRWEDMLSFYTLGAWNGLQRLQATAS